MEDVYIQTASRTEAEAKAAAETLGLGRVRDSSGLEVGSFIDSDGDVITVSLDEEIYGPDSNEIGPNQEVNENLAVDLFEVRFADYYSINEEQELNEAEYLIAVKAFNVLLAAQTTNSARALIISAANKMRLDLVTDNVEYQDRLVTKGAVRRGWLSKLIRAWIAPDG